MTAPYYPPSPPTPEVELPPDSTVVADAPPDAPSLEDRVAALEAAVFPHVARAQAAQES